MITTIDETIIKSIARTLYVLAWLDYQVRVLGKAYGGQLMDVCPEPTPPEAFYAAYYVAGRFYQANTRTLHFLCRDALGADLGRTLLKLEAGDEKLLTEAFQRDFGHDLAMMITGTGVSWFDDHKKFNLKMPMYMEWNHLACNIPDEWLMREP